MAETLTQRTLFTSEQFTLEYNGVKVYERGWNKRLEYVIPFEKIPSSPFFLRQYRREAIIFGLFGIVVVTFLLIAQLNPSGNFPQPNGVIATALFTLVPALVFWFTRQELIGYGLPGNGLILYANRPSRKDVTAFLEAVQAKKLAYLRELYLDHAGEATPDDQLRRLIWLKDMGVLSSEELEARKQKLLITAPSSNIGFRSS